MYKQTTPYWQKIANQMIETSRRDAERKARKAAAAERRTHQLFGLEFRARVKGVSA